MKKLIFPTVIFICAALFSYSLFLRAADAYTVGAGQNPQPITSSTVAGYVNEVQQMMNSKSPLPGAPFGLSGVLNGISQWFQNIMALGAQSTGAPVPITIAGPLGSSITVPAQNILAQFDAWLYGIAHFHIALFINFVFGLVVWVLGIAKDAVNWLNSIFGSAAGK
jgi:hypothetical protein